MPLYDLPEGFRKNCMKTDCSSIGKCERSHSADWPKRIWTSKDLCIDSSRPSPYLLGGSIEDRVAFGQIRGGKLLQRLTITAAALAQAQASYCADCSGQRYRFGD